MKRNYLTFNPFNYRLSIKIEQKHRLLNVLFTIKYLNVPPKLPECIEECVSWILGFQLMFDRFDINKYLFYRYEIIAARINNKCSINLTLIRHVSNAELSTILRPFYFAVHPDLFGQHPEQRVHILTSHLLGVSPSYEIRFSF